MLWLSYLHTQKAHVRCTCRTFSFFYFPDNQKKTFTSLIFLKKYIMIKWSGKLVDDEKWVKWSTYLHGLDSGFLLFSETF